MTADHRETDVFDAVAVCHAMAHLNRCRWLENLRLARWAAGDPWLARAWLAGINGHGVDVLAESAQGPLVLRLAFGSPAVTLMEAGEEMRRLYRAACRSPG